ncbi:MAG: Gfo/Idh/MocA family oxidoreductase [Renibacterium sp.]|nr:Gfo/Idh/MocA family oxidoreductase [Renibacterium sp.]
MASSSTLGLGIIGLGAMGATLMRAAREHSDFTVRAAADPSESARLTAAGLIPGVRLSADPDAVLSDPGVDLVYIATPPAFHHDLSLAAFARGKHVFCEKPLSVSLAEGEAMARAAAESGRVSGVNFALSDRSSVLHLEQQLADGALGDVRGVEIRLQFPQWPRPFQEKALWLNGREQGGFVREVLSHFIYLTQRLFGPLEVRFHDARFPADGSAETWLSAALTAGGIPVQITAAAGIGSETTYEWFAWGTESSYLLKDWAKLSQFRQGQWQPVPMPVQQGDEASRLALLAAAIRGGSLQNIASFDAALGVQRVIEQLVR